MRLVGPALLVGAFSLDVLAVLSPATASVAAAAQQYNDRQQPQRLPGTAPSDPAAVRALGAVPAVNQAVGGVATAQQHNDAYAPAKASDSAAGLPMRRAYATLLYSDFIEGTRALGQSLRDSGTTADTVVLVTPDVRQETRERLAQDGWM